MAWRSRGARLDEGPVEGPRTSASVRSMEQAISDDDPVDAATSTSAATVPLEVHLLDVERRAEELAGILGLPGPLRRAVGLAGRLHDLGKADPRFQVMLHGGSRLRAEASGRLVAKSGMDPTDRRAFEAARERSGWPRGMRHEALSAVALDTLATEHPSIVAGLDLDLVRHLVAAHHGRARPLLPPRSDPDPQQVRIPVPGANGDLSFEGKAALVDWRAPARFERLGSRYGWWGLALLETVLRLADHTCSAAYAAHARSPSAPASEHGPPSGEGAAQGSEASEATA
jgi:CRISPR-associated endonuclease/helicase Cas3